MEMDSSKTTNPAPPVVMGVPANTSTDLVPWSTGLFDCFNDPPDCCLTFWCPCISFGQISEIVDQGSSSCGVNAALYLVIGAASTAVSGLNCACFYSCFYRTQMRRQFSLMEDPCSDCLVHTFCEQCALCQERRELKARGYDVAIGWYANQQKQSQNAQFGMGTVPPAEQGMSRDKE